MDHQTQPDGPGEPIDDDAVNTNPSLDEAPGPQAAVPPPPPPSVVPPRPTGWADVGDPTLAIYRPRFLFNTNMAMWKYILIMGTASLVPSLMLSFGLSVTGIMSEENGPKFEDGPVVLMWYMMAVWAPVVETLMMAGILWLLSFATGSKTKLAIISASIWALFHSLVGFMQPEPAFTWAWGVVIAWPFFVFSCGYLAWRDKSVGHGLVVAMGLHAFQNFLPSLVYVVMTLSGK